MLSSSSPGAAVQWADEALQGQLDWTGPAAWPGPWSPTTSRMPAAGGSAMLDAAEADGVKQDERWDPML
jgi:hypothetical protein